ncbi:MAR-binding filament-like protein 1-1 [Coffea eugenioides]|uniref:MAR-binding filament-like protein 1-1 n=1 Tax=Coffea eugenioides TaxID=49369 RepID=UPI000F609A82|nr:MAR-binding filament-like protein 1-1 [Coffea eugenioides]
MGIMEKISKVMELNEEKKTRVQALMSLALGEWEEFDSHLTPLRNSFDEGFNELGSREKKLNLLQESVNQSTTKLDARRLWIEQKIKELDEKENLMKGLLQRIEEEQMQLGNLRGFVDEKLKDVALQEKLFDGLSEKLQLIRAEIERRENVLDLEVKKSEIRESELDSRERKLEIEGNELNLKEKKLEMRENELDSREKKLEIRENEIDLREKNVYRRQHELDVKKKSLKTRENELDAIEQHSDRKQLELDSKGKILQRKDNELDIKHENLESREKDIESKERELEGKENELNAKEKKFRKIILDLGLKFVSILESAEQCDKEPNADTSTQTAEQTQKSRKRLRNLALASDRILDAAEETGNNLSRRSCIHDKEAEQVTTHDLGESGMSSAHCLIFRIYIIYISKSSAFPGAVNIHKNDYKSQACSTQQTLVLDVSQSESNSRDNLQTPPFINPGALANNTGKEKLECLFNVGETWACFNAKDHMPRSYVQIIKVIKKGGNCRLGVVWLKPLPGLPGENEWIKAGLPVGCGMFNRERTSVESPSVFSHRVFCVGKEGYPYCILPNEGEIWAIYKDWDIIKWGCHPENHRQCKYELVEILSYLTDPSSSVGFRVACLDKIGHVNSFWRRSQHENNSFLIMPNDFYRFSHKLTSRQMNCNVTDGVQDGVFEIEHKFLPPGL